MSINPNRTQKHLVSQEVWGEEGGGQFVGAKIQKSLILNKIQVCFEVILFLACQF